MASNTPSRSALRPLPAATTASADFSLRVPTSAFQPSGEISPGKNALLHCTTAGSTPPRLDHESFTVSCPLALLGSAFYPVLVHRLAIYAPRFLPTFGRPHAVALHFARCDQLTAGLAPAGVRPCWAHIGIGGSHCRLRPCHTTRHAGPHRAVEVVEVIRLVLRPTRCPRLRDAGSAKPVPRCRGFSGFTLFTRSASFACANI